MNRMLHNLDRTIWWLSLKWKLLQMESRRGMWLFVGQVGIAFRIFPRFETRLMVRRGATWGIRISQFGPLIVTWKEKVSL